MTTPSEEEARAEARARHERGELYDLTKSRITTFVEGAMWAASRVSSNLPHDPEWDHLSDLRGDHFEAARDRVVEEARNVAHLDGTGIIGRLIAVVDASRVSTPPRRRGAHSMERIERSNLGAAAWWAYAGDLGHYLGGFRTKAEAKDAIDTWHYFHPEEQRERDRAWVHQFVQFIREANDEGGRDEVERALRHFEARYDLVPAVPVLPGEELTIPEPDCQESDDLDIPEDRPCAACGKNPAEGFASVTHGGVERWYCHPDEGPSCYVSAPSLPTGLEPAHCCAHRKCPGGSLCCCIDDSPTEPEEKR